MLLASPNTLSDIKRLQEISKQLTEAQAQWANREELQSLLKDAQSAERILRRMVIRERRISELKEIGALLDKVDLSLIPEDAREALENGLQNRDKIPYVLRCLKYVTDN
jgi:replicative superfamily II helicase